MIGLFFILPVSSILLCFIRDHNRWRAILINGLLIANGLFFLWPMIYAYMGSRPDGNMWDESGSGAVLWFYFYVFPISLVAQIILLILKLKFKK